MKNINLFKMVDVDSEFVDDLIINRLTEDAIKLSNDSSKKHPEDERMYLDTVLGAIAYLQWIMTPSEHRVFKESIEKNLKENYNDFYGT